ncbi:hypothetical protein ACP4OV_014708 [Aristida adscensionis]
MADLFGLAKSAVEGTLSLAKTAMEEEEKIQSGVKRDLLLISDEFETMHAFLGAVAAAGEPDDVSRAMVRQVRNMALDVEDCIESAIHLDVKPHWWFRMLPFFLPKGTAVAALDQVAATMALLKARIEAMGQRHSRYSHAGNSGSKPPATPPPPSAVEKTAASYLEKPLLMAAAAAAAGGGRKQGGDIIKLITATSCDKMPCRESPKVVSVWGTGGGDHGMTQIIANAYSAKNRIPTAFRCRAWMEPPYPSSRRDLHRELRRQFNRSCRHGLKNGSQADGAIAGEKPATEGDADEVLVEDFGEGTRYLLVLNGISSMEMWLTIRANLPQWMDSCIVVLTRHLEVASLCVERSCTHLELQVSELEQRFSPDHPVCVFFKAGAPTNVPKSDSHVSSVKSEPIEQQKQIGSDFTMATSRQMEIGSDFIRLAIKKGIKVISVWGIAGAGKSSVAKYLYDKKLPELNCNKYVWVDVSHPFNLKDLSWKILLDLHSESIKDCIMMLEIKDPIHKCRELLQKLCCFIVIDGLQSKEEWNLIEAEFKTRDFNSHIIVITNEKSVAKHCASGKNAVLNIKSLQVDGALEVIKEKFKVHQSEDRQVGTEDIVHSYLQEIVPRCGGLPKVIVAVGDYLASQLKNKKDDQQIERTCRMLKDGFMHTLETNQAFNNLGGLFKWVDSYFRVCRDSIKPCIFYLSIFPMNHIIRQRRLTRRWIAEGYSRVTKESTAEENAQQFMSDLIKLSMVHLLDVTPTMGIFKVSMPLCQVSGFFREYIMSRSMEENLVFALEGRCKVRSQGTGRHLTIHDSWDRDQNVFESIDFSRLRSFTVFGEWRSFFISNKMRLLRVIDLEDTEGLTDEDLEKMMKVLPRLKFLSLRGCREITCLSDALGGLQQLQTLDVRDTSIVKLPMAITKLRKLEYVRAGTTLPSVPIPRSRPHTPAFWSKLFRRRPALAGGVKVPRDIEKLSALHTLGVVNINGSNSGRAAILKNLKKNLSQLHKLGVCGVNQRNSEEFCSAISGHGHLESLSVQLDRDNQASCLDEISMPPENLRSLKLLGLVGRLPEWVKGLRNLRKLNLQMATRLPQDEMDVLSNLPKLEILCLCCREFEDGKLQFGKGFSQLFVLEITCNSKLKVVTFDDGGKEFVEILKIHYSGVSLLRFSGLNYLRKLNTVSLSGSYDDILKQRLQIQIDDHPRKPVLKVERQWNQVQPDGY